MALREAYEEAKRLAPYYADSEEDEFDEEEDALSLVDSAEVSLNANTQIELTALDMADWVSNPKEEPMQEDLLAAERQQAMEQLESLLVEENYSDFLQRLLDIDERDVFAGLDERHEYLGQVALLIQQHPIADPRWSIRIGNYLRIDELVGFYESDFYESDFHFYNAMRSYQERYRQHRTSTIVEDEDNELEQLQREPGFMYLYEVMTGEFDHEKLLLLLQSRQHRELADQLLVIEERSDNIRVNPESKAWWYRNARGQQEQAPQPIPRPPREASPPKTSFFGGWIMFVLAAKLMVFIIYSAVDTPSPVRDRSSPDVSALLGGFMEQQNALCPPTTNKSLIRMVNQVESLRWLVMGGEELRSSYFGMPVTYQGETNGARPSGKGVAYFGDEIAVYGVYNVVGLSGEAVVKCNNGNVIEAEFGSNRFVSNPVIVTLPSGARVEISEFLLDTPASGTISNVPNPYSGRLRGVLPNGLGTVMLADGRKEVMQFRAGVGSSSDGGSLDYRWIINAEENSHYRDELFAPDWPAAKLSKATPIVGISR